MKEKKRKTIAKIFQNNRTTTTTKKTTLDIRQK